ncbi:tetratricopeptide repeat protein 4 homolog isoform X2 [Momordica charantia]|uniref:Tetratricopeptide repeat protein 4 homolog isoform X2 n=1 Tax=Momordica charantia TaxID=3673 RepID=A0A6J1E576_MOMCH|nr:tetratricopeptide repeat protein 4 homolog isoform X2 [Momordica charantia]
MQYLPLKSLLLSSSRSLSPSYEKGNEFVRLGRKHYSDAIDCYTRAINQKVLSNSENSVLFANRAHVNLLLGNYRRALNDAEEAINLCPTNIKAIYRAAKASLSLNLLDEAKSYCVSGIKCDPNNVEIKKIEEQIDSLKSEQEQREAQVRKAIAEAEKLVSAIVHRGLKIGKATYQELTGLRKPVLDKNNILHWPVLLLYAEVMSSDFIEDFCETDMFSAHLDMMFSEGCPPLPWDVENKYTREAVELYYEVGSGICLSKVNIIRHLLEGTAASNAENLVLDEKDAIECSNHDTSANEGSSKWIKVNEKRTLHDVLKAPNCLIPGIPVFYVVWRNSKFYKDFKAGRWGPPS